MSTTQTLVIWVTVIGYQGLHSFLRNEMYMHLKSATAIGVQAARLMTMVSGDTVQASREGLISDAKNRHVNLGNLTTGPKTDWTSCG